MVGMLNFLLLNLLHQQFLYWKKKKNLLVSLELDIFLSRRKSIFSLLLFSFIMWAIGIFVQNGVEFFLKEHSYLDAPVFSQVTHVNKSFFTDKNCCNVIWRVFPRISCKMWHFLAKVWHFCVKTSKVRATVLLKKGLINKIQKIFMKIS